MNKLQMHSLVVCEDRIFAQRITSSPLKKIPVCPAKDFSHDGIPFIYIFNTEVDYTKRENIYSKLLPVTKKNTIATGRVPAGATIPINQPPGTVLLPWCPDDLFLDWIAALGGFAPLPPRIHPQYFFLKSVACENTFGNYRALFQTMEGIAQWPQHQISVANIAGQTGMTARQMRKLLPKFFGAKPGKVLRAIELFRHTAILMQEENLLQLHGDGRHGNSPLAKYELEHNCNFSERLKRLLGITYRELLAGAQKEHWAALWMRKWRETLAIVNKADLHKSGESVKKSQWDKPTGISSFLFVNF